MQHLLYATSPLTILKFRVEVRRKSNEKWLKYLRQKIVHVTGVIKFKRNLQINVPEPVPVRMLNVVIWKHLICRRKVLMATLDRMTNAEVCGRCRIPLRKSRGRDECLPTDSTKGVRNKNVKIVLCSLRAFENLWNVC